MSCVLNEPELPVREGGGLTVNGLPVSNSDELQPRAHSVSANKATH